MTYGLIGKKIGMTQRFGEDGSAVPVTVIECGPCIVVQKKTVEKEGYSAVQIGFGRVEKVQRVNKARKGHFQKAGTPIFQHLAEQRLGSVDFLNVGDSLGAAIFQIGDHLVVRGRTKGRGFQGVVKRWHHKGGGASHGSHFHRAPGSIGQNSSPSRVFKNMKMPGHMGNEYRSVKNIEIVEIDVEKNLIFVKGAVPGSKNGLLSITNLGAELKDRLSNKEKVEQSGDEAKQSA